MIKVLQEVANERERQNARWGEQNHKFEKWVAILGEEFGELCQAVCQTVIGSDEGKDGTDSIRQEAIHVAAVAVALVECLDRHKNQSFDCILHYLN